MMMAEWYTQLEIYDEKKEHQPTNQTKPELT